MKKIIKYQIASAFSDSFSRSVSLTKWRNMLSQGSDDPVGMISAADSNLLCATLIKMPEKFSFEI